MLENLRKDSWAKALVADDDTYFRIALASILTGSLGVETVNEAASLDAALETLSGDHAPDVGIFHLAMPGMRGVAGLAAAREMAPQMQVIAVSSSRSRQEALDALEAGAHGFVPRTFSVGDLTKALCCVRDGMIFIPSSIADRPPLPSATMDGRARVVQDAVLTPRQRDVLRLLVQGCSNKEIARALDLGEGTVKIHLAALFRTLNVRNRAAAAVAGMHLVGALNEPDNAKKPWQDNGTMQPLRVAPLLHSIPSNRAFRQ